MGFLIAATNQTEVPHTVMESLSQIMSSSYPAVAEAKEIEPTYSALPQALRIFAPHLSLPYVGGVEEAGRYWV